MDTQAKLLELIQNSPLEDDVKATVVGLINQGPVTKGLLDDILNLLEAKAMEQDQIEKIENQKTDIYTELSGKLQEIAEEEMEAGTKNLEELADDLESVAKESKEHVRAVEAFSAEPGSATTAIVEPMVTAETSAAMPAAPTI